ncbi:hypothetical protein C8R45DRAFT_1111618 [Mycena sanguinolenta]|nr:hypothetical protein C8R45DRAFT_1111618 [Mycena sanguinolenta]
MSLQEVSRSISRTPALVKCSRLKVSLRLERRLNASSESSVNEMHDWTPTPSSSHIRLDVSSVLPRSCPSYVVSIQLSYDPDCSPLLPSLYSRLCSALTIPDYIPVPPCRGDRFSTIAARS